MANKLVLTIAASFMLLCLVFIAYAAEITVVNTFPASGATNVDPSIKELRIRFSGAVAPDGYALVGTDQGHLIQTAGRPKFAEGGTLCIWPIKLYPGLDYVVSINSEKFKGFRSAEDENAAVTPYLLKFTTSGAKPTGKAAQITVVSTYPAAGTKDVDPLSPSIKIRFSGPVCTDGWSFTTSDLGKEVPSNGRPSFSEGDTVCELSVKLEPNTTYAVGVNGGEFNGFRNAKNPDVAVTPYVLTFTTAQGEEARILYSGPPHGSCGAFDSDLRFELIGSENIKLYQMSPSGKFRVFGTVKVVQTGQICKNGWIDKDGRIISTNK